MEYPPRPFNRLQKPEREPDPEPTERIVELTIVLSDRSEESWSREEDDLDSIDVNSTNTLIVLDSKERIIAIYNTIGWLSLDIAYGPIEETDVADS